MVDTHCHIHTQEFDESRASLLHTMQQQSVQAILVGTSLEDSRKALALASQYPFLYPSLGIHPHEAESVNLDTVQTDLSQLLQDSNFIAIGECGFDFYYHSQAEVHSLQARLFQQHLELAQQYAKPLIIHTRNSFEETYQFLAQYQGLTIILHCFTGNPFWVEKYLSLKHTVYFSFSGIITFANSLSIQESVRIVPSNLILAETDAPYLTPVPHRGQQNSPLYVRYVIEKIAELRQQPYQDTISQLDSNTQQAFQLHQ